MENKSRIELTTELELKLALKLGLTVHAAGTGPFGEDTGAIVVYYGPARHSPVDLSFDDDQMSEEDFYEAFDDDMDVIVYDESIGQSTCNFMVDDGGWCIEDLELSINKF